MGVRVVLYSRRTCHLCDQAREVVLATRERTSFEFEEVFIDGDDGLERDYGLRVPVVEVNGEDAFEYEVDPESFHRLVG